MTDCNHVWQCDRKNLCLSNPPKVRYDCLLCSDVKFEPIAVGTVIPQPTMNALLTRILALELDVERLKHE